MQRKREGGRKRERGIEKDRVEKKKYGFNCGSCVEIVSERELSKKD